MEKPADAAKGKTPKTAAIRLTNATVEKPALYFTVLGEPALKMLRYQQQFSFFDDPKLGKAICEDVITEKGIVVIAPRHTDYSGLTTGIPRHVGETLESPPETKVIRRKPR